MKINVEIERLVIEGLPATGSQGAGIAGRRFGRNWRAGSRPPVPAEQLRHRWRVSRGQSWAQRGFPEILHQRRWGEESHGFGSSGNRQCLARKALGLMSKRAVQVKPGNELAARRTNLLGRGNTLGPHACVQGESRTSAGEPDASALVAGVCGSPGRPLDHAARAFMEPRFGRDFSQVRIHTDREAAASAMAVEANAYALGNHVVFGPGQYAPGNPKGQRTLAHELAHVVQQTSQGEPSRPNWNNGAISTPASPARARCRQSRRCGNSGFTGRASCGVSVGQWRGGPFHPDSSAPGPVAGATGRAADATGRAAAPARQGPPGATGGQQQIAEVQKVRPAPPEAWDKVEPILDQELVNTYHELGFIAAKNIDKQFQTFFQPYDDDLESDTTFINIINIASGGGGSGLADKLSDYASLSGGIGGAIAQAVQVYLPIALKSKVIADAKQNIKDCVDKLEEHEFTRGSHVFKTFEKGSMDKLHSEFDKWWTQYDRIGMGVTEADIAIMVPIWRDRVRDEFGAESKASQDVLTDLAKAVASYLQPLKKELNTLREQHRQRRYKVYGRAGGGDWRHHRHGAGSGALQRKRRLGYCRSGPWGVWGRATRQGGRMDRQHLLEEGGREGRGPGERLAPRLARKRFKPGG